MAKKDFVVHFGALAEPIEVQLENQGVTTSDRNIKRFNNLNQARLTLLFGDCISDKENEKITKKIFNWFKKTVKPVGRDL